MPFILSAVALGFIRVLLWSFFLIIFREVLLLCCTPPFHKVISLSLFLSSSGWDFLPEFSEKAVGSALWSSLFKPPPVARFLFPPWFLLCASLFLALFSEIRVRVCPVILRYVLWYLSAFVALFVILCSYLLFLIILCRYFQGIFSEIKKEIFKPQTSLYCRAPCPP